MRHHYLRVFFFSVFLTISFWFLAYSLAPSKSAFIHDRSWIYQIIWFPAHILLAYFAILVYKKAAFGERHQDISMRSLLNDFKKNYRAIGIALVLITPFMIQDLVEGMGELERDYETLGDATWVMIGPVWIIEWLMLAVIWSRVMATIRLTINFYTPKYVRKHLDDLLIVNHKSHLLQAGVENALINLVYAITTIGYIEFVGGETSDYQNVVISAILVLSSFLASFLYIRKRIADALEEIVAEHARRIEEVYGNHDPKFLEQAFLKEKLNIQLLSHFVFDKTAGLSKRSFERLTIVRSSLLIDSIKKNGYADSIAVDHGFQIMRYTQYEVKLSSLGMVELQGVLVRLGSPAVMFILKSGVLTNS
jgi:hypothetical protein